MLRHPRRNRDRTVADRQHAVWRVAAEAVDDGVQRAQLVVKANGHGPVPPRILELIATIAGKCETDAQLRRCLAKRADLIARRGCDDEHSLQISRMSSAAGSAQQYHASVM